MADNKGKLRTGTSGYQYDHWKKSFYPEDIPKKNWFSYYAERFDTVEINNTFYNLPAEKTFKKWHDDAPPGFRYALKFSRYGSHLKCLKDPKQTIGKFLEKSEHLKSFMGPILVQLRPGWGFNPERLEDFLKEAPRTHRWAVEFRDRKWLRDESYEILQKHNAALCIHDILEDHPAVVTADWVYMRFHGDNYRGSYSHEELSDAAGQIKDYLARNLDVYAYFNNDENAYSAHNALELKKAAGGEWRQSSTL